MTGTTTTQETPTELSTDATVDATAAEQVEEAEAGETGETGGLSLDLVFESLKNSRRRQVLRYLQEAEGSASVGELAEHVAAIENDTTVQALSSQQRKRVYVGLYQCHLPKLDDKDVVEYDDDRGTVDLGPNASQLERYLAVADGEAAEGDDRPWHVYYAGLAVSAVAVLVLGGLVAGGSTIGTVAAVVGLGLVAGVAGLALVQGQGSV